MIKVENVNETLTFLEFDFLARVMTDIHFSSLLNLFFIDERLFDKQVMEKVKNTHRMGRDGPAGTKAMEEKSPDRNKKQC